MIRLALISALVATTFAAPRVHRVPMLDGRIVGGEAVSIDDYPHQLSLQYRGSHICGASIIAPRAALTAAHCTDGSAASSLSVRAGSSIRGSGGQVVLVRRICQHANYDSWTIDNDVSVLTLASELTVGSPISLLPPGSVISPGTPATVSGWGTLSSGGSLPSRLQAVSVPKVSQDDCKSAYGSSAITDRMTCYGFTRGGKDSCQGDSGGPLISEGVQVGVVSWGYGCAAPNYPGVYADVSNADLASHIDLCKG